MHLGAAGGCQQQPPRCCYHRRYPREDLRDGTGTGLRRNGQLEMQRRGHIRSVHDDLGDRHAGPACRIGESAGTPRACGPKFAQLGGEHMRCGQYVIHLLERRGSPTITKHGQSPVGATSDLTGVEQLRVLRRRRRPSLPARRRLTWRPVRRAMLSAVDCVQGCQSTRCLTPRSVRHGAIERAILQAVPTDSEGPGHERRPARQPHR